MNMGRCFSGVDVTTVKVLAVQGPVDRHGRTERKSDNLVNGVALASRHKRTRPLSCAEEKPATASGSTPATDTLYVTGQLSACTPPPRPDGHPPARA